MGLPKIDNFIIGVIRKRKMKILAINSVNFGSTGNIMLGIADLAKSKGINTYICVPKSRDNSKKQVAQQIFIGNRILRNVHNMLGQFTGYQGCFSLISTWDFLHKISKIKPDIIHLHNLHGNYINLPMLFRYIKKHNISVIWTLHDCWAFTGQCPHFTMVKCDRWKDGCFSCSQYMKYPKARVDRTKIMWRLKKRWFTGVENMTIVTPSQWLANLVKESYLKEYPVMVIHNGIILNIFKPTESNFREKYDLENKFVVLGVAFNWGKRKGLDVFIELEKRLDEKYQIVLLGTNNEIDKKLPNNIISIHRTENQKELAEIYTAADVFVNPTREENYPTVNMEAIACGTPVITFNTGGSPEILDQNTGYVVVVDDIDGMEKQIVRVCTANPFCRERCLNKAQEFDQRKKYEEYLALYKSILGECFK